LRLQGGAAQLLHRRINACDVVARTTGTGLAGVVAFERAGLGATPIPEMRKYLGAAVDVFFRINEQVLTRRSAELRPDQGFHLGWAHRAAARTGIPETGFRS